MRTRAESHVHSSERYRAHEQKVSRTRAKVMRSRERKRLKGQLFFRTVRCSSRIFGNKLNIKRKTLLTSGFFSIKNDAARVLFRDRAEGRAGGALAPPPRPHFFCKNKNKFLKKIFTKKFSFMHSSLAPLIENLLRGPCYSIPFDHTSKYKPRSRVLAFIDAF